MKNIYQYLIRLSKIGIKDNASYIEIKQVQMVNIIAITCLIPPLIFTIINFNDGRLLLALINFLTSFSYLLVIFLQYHHRQNAAKILLVGFNFLLFFTSALIFRNAGEYFLISIIIISMLLFDNSIKLVIWGVILVIAILIVYAFPDLNLFPAVPYDRGLYNIVCALILSIIALIFFKYVIYHDKKLIEHQRRKLNILNIEKEKIFSIIAHDLRTPLHNASSLLEAFQSTSLSREQLNDFINSIKQQINDQNRVLENILEWSSRKMMGESSIASVVTINKVITSLLDDFEVALKNKNIEVICNIPPYISILADPEHIKIIFRNILSNAIKFSYPEGQINIFSRVAKNGVNVTIQDYGVGIPASKINAISKKIQNRSSGTHNEPGAGLGLMLCKELIDLNQGSLTISSNKDFGTLFTVTFPMVHPAQGNEWTPTQDSNRFSNFNKN